MGATLDGPPVVVVPPRAEVVEPGEEAAVDDDDDDVPVDWAPPPDEVSAEPSAAAELSVVGPWAAPSDVGVPAVASAWSAIGPGRVASESARGRSGLEELTSATTSRSGPAADSSSVDVGPGTEDDGPVAVGPPVASMYSVAPSVPDESMTAKVRVKPAVNATQSAASPDTGDIFGRTLPTVHSARTALCL